jgi:hypothetical protein
MATTADPTAQDWRSAWPDAAAFATVLFIAWWTRASSGDLVWSLWLSSLVVGYSIILWAIIRPMAVGALLAWRDRALVEEALRQADPRSTLLVATLGLVGVLFVLAFFTVHFVGFHAVHASLLSSFFPVGADHDASRPLHGVALFREVARRYWVFLPPAFLAERSAFFRRPAPAPDVSVTAAAIAARKSDPLRQPASRLMLPYLQVLRMHLLIFFFAFAHSIRLDNFAVYAVVYSVYFFPWRLLRATPAAAGITPA